MKKKDKSIDMPFINLDVDDSRTLDISNEPKINKFSIANSFHKVCDITLKNESDIKFDLEGRPKTLLNFIILPEYQKECGKIYGGTIYIILFNKRIIKIGETARSLKSRISSYMSGNRQNRWNKNNCSLTNYRICEYLYTALKSGIKCEMLAYHIPIPNKISVNIFGESVMIAPKVSKTYEGYAIDKFKDEFGYKPILSSNKGK